MSSCATPTPSILARPWGDIVSSVDCDVVTGALFALFVQHAWDGDEKSSTLLSDECSVPCLPTMQQTGMAKADEEVCDFVGASAGLGKLPVYNTAEDLDQTLEVLNAHSVPELQTGLFLGVGLVSPIYATVDISMRTIRRAGKSVLRKKILKREKMASDAAYNYNYLYRREPNVTCEDREVFAHREAVGDKSSAGMPKTSDRLLERVMRPVSFSQAESK